MNYRVYIDKVFRTSIESKPIVKAQPKTLLLTWWRETRPSSSFRITTLKQKN